MKHKAIVILWVVGFLFGDLAVFGAARYTRNRQGRNNPGQTATDFELRTLDGGKFKLSAQKGKLVVLQFGPTW